MGGMMTISNKSRNTMKPESTEQEWRDRVTQRSYDYLQVRRLAKQMRLNPPFVIDPVTAQAQIESLLNRPRNEAEARAEDEVLRTK